MREYLSLYNNNFNFVTKEYCAKTNPENDYIWSNIEKYYKKRTFYGNNTKKLVQKYNPKLIEEENTDNFDIQHLNEKNIIYYDHSYRFYGYQGNSESINIPIKLNGIYKLIEIDLSICSLSNTVEEIYISLSYGMKDNIDDYFAWLFHNNKIFGLTYEELKKTNVKKIVIPKSMYEFHRESIKDIIEEGKFFIKYYNINEHEA